MGQSAVLHSLYDLEEPSQNFPPYAGLHRRAENKLLKKLIWYNTKIIFLNQLIDQSINQLTS